MARYIVSVADKRTARSFELALDAASEEGATQQAISLGYLVSGVRLDTPDSSTADQELRRIRKAIETIAESRIIQMPRRLVAEGIILYLIYMMAFGGIAFMLVWAFNILVWAVERWKFGPDGP